VRKRKGWRRPTVMLIEDVAAASVTRRQMHAGPSMPAVDDSRHLRPRRRL